MTGLGAVAELCLAGVTPISGLIVTAPPEVPVVERQQGRIQATVGELVLDAPAAYESELRALAAGAAEVLPRLELDLGVRASAPYRIYLVPSPGRRSGGVSALDARAPSWASGYLVPSQRVGGIRLDRVSRYPYGDALMVLTHEVTHMLLHDAVAAGLPTWFEEGVATWQGRRWGLRDAFVFSSNLLTGELPQLDRLEGYFRSSPARARAAYAAAFDFVSWSVRRYGQGSLARVIALADELPFEAAWQEATGTPLSDSEARWRRGSIFVYRWLPLLSGSGTLWLGITSLALLAGLRRRQRTREILARWEAEEGRAEDGAEDGSERSAGGSVN